VNKVLSALVVLGLIASAAEAQTELKKPKGKVAEKVGGAKDKEELKTKAVDQVCKAGERNLSTEQRIEVTVEVTVKITTTIKVVDDKTEKLTKNTEKKGNSDVASKCKSQADKVDKAAKKADAKSKKAKTELDERQELYEFLVELNDAVNDLDDVINAVLDLAIALDDVDLFLEAVELYETASDLAALMFDLGLVYADVCWEDWDEESRDQQCEWLAYILVNWFSVDDEESDE
jgi:hypothetical protein